MTRVVYALVDPVLDVVVYVGQAIDAKRRERQYRRCRNISNWLLREWLRVVGYREFEFRILEVVETGDLDSVEAHFISHYKQAGQAAFNVKAYGCFGTPKIQTEDDRREAFALAGILHCYSGRRV